MKLRDLQYLVAVADHGHFGRAAEACFVSQPTLSTQIRKLEAELGVELVERSARQAMLTPVGERVVERARVVLEETRDIERIARQAQDPESGSVRLGIFPTLAPYLLPHVVPAIGERFPNLELLLVEEKTEEVLARLRDGRLDLGILALPVHDVTLQAEELFVEDFVLAVPADHPLAAEDGPVDPTGIGGEQVLLLEEGHCLRDQALDVCRLAGASERAGFRATSLETLRQMVSAGVGVTLLPQLSVQPPVPSSPELVTIAFAEPVPQRTIALFWRRTSPYGELAPKLAEVIRDLPPGIEGVSPAAPEARVAGGTGDTGEDESS